ncbi:MAG: hypothetical protein KGL46_09930 [Hyphomicrobiales bacterium]|nr:hypothetical protein [Hyphomicrobiales bacterium]
MRHYDDNQQIYDAPVRSFSLSDIALPVVAVVGFLVIGALDGATIQVFGYLLYPIERALNAVFFPNAATPLRGNGTALLVLIPTIAVAGIAYSICRAVCLALRSGNRDFPGRR